MYLSVFDKTSAYFFPWIFELIYVAASKSQSSKKGENDVRRASDDIAWQSDNTVINCDFFVEQTLYFFFRIDLHSIKLSEVYDYQALNKRTISTILFFPSVSKRDSLPFRKKVGGKRERALERTRSQNTVKSCISLKLGGTQRKRTRKREIVQSSLLNRCANMRT